MCSKKGGLATQNATRLSLTKMSEREINFTPYVWRDPKSRGAEPKQGKDAEK
jgi:hypothetical protein